MADLKDFRLYVLDREGHIAKAEVIHLDSDEKAIEVAREKARGGVSVELWHRAQQIARITADSPETVERLWVSTSPAL